MQGGVVGRGLGSQAKEATAAMVALAVQDMTRILQGGKLAGRQAGGRADWQADAHIGAGIGTHSCIAPQQCQHQTAPHCRHRRQRRAPAIARQSASGSRSTAAARTPAASAAAACVAQPLHGAGTAGEAAAAPVAVCAPCLLTAAQSLASHSQATSAQRSMHPAGAAHSPLAWPSTAKKQSRRLARAGSC